MAVQIIVEDPKLEAGMPVLKHCPFDLGPAELETNGRRRRPYRVRCTKCGSGTEWYGFWVLAVNHWNKRPKLKLS